MIVGILGGPTAIGKSALALSLAERNGFRILSADSRQIYRGMSIGTGAPTVAERAKVPHHLVGILDPSESFSPREFPARVHAELAAHPEARFLLVGGTGLYLKELLYPAARDRGPTPEAVRKRVQDRLATEGPAALHAELSRLDPASLLGVHPNDAYRIAKRWENHLITGEGYGGFAGPAVMDPRFAGVPLLRLDDDRAALYARIDGRVEDMVRSGWLDEVRALMARPGWEDFPALSSLGYREMSEVVTGAPLASALADVQKRTRNYAKRQLTFFRGQFPTAETWSVDLLRASLEAVDWDWNRFRATSSPPPPQAVQTP
jgi:tRNA dimethylallyltransferase